MRLKNKVAIVTGANQGIGQVIACRIAGEGARTVIAARNELNLQRTAKKITSDGGGAASLLRQTSPTKPP